MLKFAIALVFLIMLTSLATGAGFLLRDGGASRRLLISLKLRVACAVVLLALLFYGFHYGGLAG